MFFKDVLELEKQTAKDEAEKVKSVLSDTTLNSLAKYVHKVLDFNNLDCNYDINKEKCRCCARNSLKGKVKNC